MTLSLERRDDRPLSSVSLRQWAHIELMLRLEEQLLEQSAADVFASRRSRRERARDVGLETEDVESLLMAAVAELSGA